MEELAVKHAGPEVGPPAGEVLEEAGLLDAALGVKAGELRGEVVELGDGARGLVGVVADLPQHGAVVVEAQGIAGVDAGPLAAFVPEEVADAGGVAGGVDGAEVRELVE